jgi:hypothetical protein
MLVLRWYMSEYQTYVEYRDGMYRYETHRKVEQLWLPNNTFTEVVSLPEADDIPIGVDCLYAVYRRADTGTANHVWVYDLARGDYPELDETISTKLDTFLPVVPIRENNVDYTDISRAETAQYKTSVELLKTLKIDFLGLGTLINSNENIGELDFAYVMWGVDLQTEIPMSLRYLHKFFDKLGQEQTTNDIEAYQNYLDPTVLQQPLNKYTASVGSRFTNPKPSFAEAGLNLIIHHDFITTEIISGDVGERGLVTSRRVLIHTNFNKHTPILQPPVTMKVLPRLGIVRRSRGSSY